MRPVSAVALALLLLGSCAALHAEDRKPGVLLNGDFTVASGEGDAHIPAGWEHRTRGKGTIRTHTQPDAGTGDPAFVEIGVKQPGEDSFIQQTVPLSDDTVSVAWSAKVRYTDVKPGDKSYQKAQVQARYTKDGKEIGKWIGLGSFEGSSDGWRDIKAGASRPADANGILLRLALYGVKSGRMDVADVTLTAKTKEDVAAERTKWRPAEPFGQPVSDARYARLMRGININNWFCQPWNIQVNGQRGGFNAPTFRAYITEHDLKMIRSAGFDHVRLPIDPLFLMDYKTGELKPELLPELDRGIQMILDHDLAVIVDIHPKSPALKGLSGKPALADLFVQWWGHFAAHLSKTDPERVFLEPMNEPGGQGYWWSNYQPFQDRLLLAIRAAAPQHTIIVTSGGYMLVDDLLKITEPHPDRNTLWAVHYYNPSPFTHQGAVWMKDWYRPLRNVPWPLTAENLDAAIAGLDRSGKNKDYVQQTEQVLRDQVAKGYSTEQWLRDDMARIARWGQTHQRRVVIGEFGVYEKYVDRASRLAYLRALTGIMAEHGIGWSKWDYAGGGFQIVLNPEAPSAERKPDLELLRALGLAPSAE